LGLVIIVQVFAFLLFVLVRGWYCAYLLSIVESAAAGDDHLPGVDLSVSGIVDAVAALLKWVTSWVIVLLPAILYRTWYWYGVSTASGAGAASGRLPLWAGDVLAVFAGLPAIFALPPGGVVPFKLLLILGLLLWPMVLLCLVLGGLATLWRFDLLLITIYRTIGAYAATVALMLGACVLEYLLITAVITKVVTAAGGPSPGTIFTTAFVLGAVLLGIRVYFDIVLMRLIGLYYHHFKRMFAWDWG